MAGYYSPTVLDHFRNPRNVGEIVDAHGVGEAANPVCGDTMRLYLKIEEGRIADARFKTFGCAAAIAASSMATEIMKGRSLQDAMSAVTSEAVTDALGGLPPGKTHCSVLAADALEAALGDYRRRHGHSA